LSGIGSNFKFYILNFKFLISAKPHLPGEVPDEAWMLTFTDRKTLNILSYIEL